MNKINNTSVVKQQYANANNLNTRISIHDKYSTNKMGFGNWIMSNYRIDEKMKVLELGCGTGDMWKNSQSLIKACSKLILSDFSEGMVATTKSNIGNYENTEYKVIDIQEIPYENETFDVVIANMMLYHVPDIDKGLNEVRRVLKKGGHFYCATYGEHGIIEYLSKILSKCSGAIPSPVFLIIILTLFLSENNETVILPFLLVCFIALSIRFVSSY